MLFLKFSPHSERGKGRNACLLGLERYCRNSTGLPHYSGFHRVVEKKSAWVGSGVVAAAFGIAGKLD
ncbi:hypothetical protein KY289_035723 [Solanum tuberosum]|nr:hypothetical protein KY284_035580 [Solanum tuberosum]KAH0635808.1 hypothetical protein KY289_035723 [Solanum tuberosum]